MEEKGLCGCCGRGGCGGGGGGGGAGVSVYLWKKAVPLSWKEGV